MQAGRRGGSLRSKIVAPARKVGLDSGNRRKKTEKVGKERGTRMRGGVRRTLMNRFFNLKVPPAFVKRGHASRRSSTDGKTKTGKKNRNDFPGSPEKISSRKEKESPRILHASHIDRKRRRTTHKRKRGRRRDKRRKKGTGQEESGRA